MSFANKTVLITGAASGIGKAIAKYFAKESANLSLLDIDEDNLYKTAEECEKLGSAKVIKATIDITRDADIEQAVEITKKVLKEIHILINCAGVAGTTSITDSEVLKKYDRVMNTNLRSVLATCHFAIQALIESKGCIINISSVLSQFICKNSIGYCVSKAGVTHLTKCLALDVAEFGVRVNCIAPGAVKTNIFLNKGVSEEENKQFWSKLTEKTAFKQTVKAEDVAALVVYLASDTARAITGVEYIIDNGFSIATNS